MNLSFYTGAVSAHQQNQRMSIQGNNIANVNTYGFKAEKGRFDALWYQQIKAVDEEDPLVGSGAKLLMSSTDYRQGAPLQTRKPQDYMIEGDGFFAVRDLATNEITLTRNGAFSVAPLSVNGTDDNGVPGNVQRWYLSDGNGRFVLNQAGNMIEVADPNAVQPVGIFDCENYDGMQHLDGTRFIQVEKNGMLRMGTGKLIHGSLETSNVDLAEEISKVIESQRAYSMALKLVQVSDELETTVNNLRG